MSDQIYRNKISETYNKLVLTGLPERDPRLHEIKLENIFVKLNIAIEENFRPGFERVLEHSDNPDEREKTRYFEQRFEKQTVKTISTAEALQKYRYLIITGSPGSGKTTLLRWLAVTFADKRQTENLGKAFTEEVIPVLLELRRFSKRFQTLTESQPATFDLAAEISEFVGSDPRFDGVSAEWMQQTLKEKPCLLLIDGLDEIADNMTRQRLLEAVEAFVQTSTYARVRCLLTTRPHGFQDVSLGAKFQKTEVQAFDAEDIAAFIRHWYVTAYAAEYQQEAEELITAIQAQDRVTELAENPLLCTIIAIIYRNNRVLPNRRVELYLKCCEALLDTWERNKKEIVAQSPLIGRFDWQVKLELLMPIAYRFHEQAQKLVLPEAEVEKLLAETLEKFDLRSGKEAEQEARQFIGAIRDRSGLLQGRGDGTLEFSHRTFQEYLAARYIAAQPDYIDLVMPHLHKAWWREVHLLVMGHLGSGSDTALKAEKLMLTILSVYKEPNALLLPPNVWWWLRWFKLEKDWQLTVAKKLLILHQWLNLGMWFHRLQWQKRVAWHTLREFELVAQSYAGCTATAKTKKLSQTLSEFAFKRFSKWKYNPFYSRQYGLLLTILVKNNLPCEQLIETLLKNLPHRNKYIQSFSASSLVLLGQENETVIDVLRAALCDEYYKVRRAAAKELGQLKQVSDVVIDSLLKALLDKHAEVRRDAAASLGKLSQASEAIIDALLNALSDKNGGVRRAAVESLGKLDMGSEAVINALIKTLSDKHGDVRSASATSLGKLGQASKVVIDALLKALFDEKWYVRSAATQSLGQLNQTSEIVIDALLKALLDKDEFVQKSSISSLEKLGQSRESIVNILVKSLLDNDEKVRFAAASSLAQLGQTSELVINILLKALLDNDEYVRCAAAESLGQLNHTSEAVIDALLKALLDNDEYVQYAAAESLGQLNHASEAVISTLIKALFDKEEYVRRAAADSLLDKLKIKDEKIIKQILIRLNYDLHSIDAYQAFASLRKHLNGKQIPGYLWKSPLRIRMKKWWEREMEKMPEVVKNPVYILITIFIVILGIVNSYIYPVLSGLMKWLGF